MRRHLMLSLAALALAAPASGAVLDTAPALAAYAGSYLICHVQNVSTSPREVTLQLLDYSGSVLKEDTATIEPDRSWMLSANPDPIFAASCRFVVNGSAKYVRASASYYDPDTSRTTVAVPAE